ncbi:hypothetical protein RJ640_028884 [Escallonia rubra]|uniref:Peptidase A1 domain-containing protein n=1 Tax=Escallonia rubra TaxID=112253 RepID=A0AA88QAU9_9ASTE|nr:hypothetical protein RJ640_028884 [Escallonia rubra]
MASSIYVSMLFLVFSFPLSLALPAVPALILPILKNNTAQQYYTTIEMGLPSTYVSAVIDLGAQYVWFNCDGFSSPSYRPIRCGSTKCKRAKGASCFEYCNHSTRPGCTNNTCGVGIRNPFRLLGEDGITVSSTDGKSFMSAFEAPDFLFSCSDSSFSEGVAGGTEGIAGLARTKTALHTQLTSAFKLPNKFALCMPSSSESFPGVIFLGGGSYYIFDHPTENPKDYSKSLISTPLINNPVNTATFAKREPSDEYFIRVKSISVNDKPVLFTSSLLSIDKKGVGGTKLSTITPHTVLHNTIYKALVSEFVRASALKKIKRVKPVAPFGACFSSRTIASSQTGPAVPVIDLVLQDKTSRWRIYGANSMVKVKKDVLCLGFVDGGLEPQTSIVLGGYQLENNLVEFDLTSSKLRFSNSLLLGNVTCSQNRSVGP